MAVKQKQSQKQNVNVNIHLGEKKKKGKPRKRKTGKKEVKRNETRIIPAFNPPSIINYPPAFQQQNQPNNWFNPPPPIPQKQYTVLPEGETALLSGLLPNVPVPLHVEKLKEKAKEPQLVPEQYTVINEPFKPAKEEYTIISPAPAPEPAPEEYTIISPAPAPEFSAEVPPTFEVGEKTLSAPFSVAEGGGTPSPEENALKYILEFGTQQAPVFNQPPATGSLLPEEPPSPSGSTLSGLSEFTPAYSEVGVSLVKRPKPIDLSLVPRNAPERLEGYNLSKVSQSLPLPPIGPSAQPLVSSGLTAYTQPSNFPPEYLFEEGATALIPAKPKKANILKVLTEEERLAKEEKDRLEEEKRQKALERKYKQPKVKPQKEQVGLIPKGQVQYGIPVRETEAFPIPAQLSAEGAYSLSAPLSQQPSAVFLGGTEKTFSTEPPPEKVSGLQRQRRVIERATAITPAEQNLLLNP